MQLHSIAAPFDRSQPTAARRRIDGGALVGNAPQAPWERSAAPDERGRSDSRLVP